MTIFCASAQSQNIIRIYLNNGTFIDIPINNIDSITYSNTNPGNFASITTVSTSNLTTNSATSGGNITSDGGSPITQRGICWATTQNPTTANNTALAGNGIGNFSVNLAGLTANTTYYVRAYAINTAGTAYGNQVSFTTSSGSGTTSSQFNPNLTYGTMNDIDGNIYKTITIGTQTWMAENLRTTRYRNGVLVNNITDNIKWLIDTTGAWCYYNNDPSKNIPYGKLYNWYAVYNANQLCPTGWHIPSYEEWEILTNYLGGNSIAGGKMKSTGTQYWNSPNEGATNSSGFSGLPGGYRWEMNSWDGGFFQRNGSESDWWGVRMSWDSIVYPTQHSLSSSTSYIYNFTSTKKQYGVNVRCLKDKNNPGNLASLTTLAIGNITNNSAASGGNITNDGGSMILQRGICWSTTQNPTTANNVVISAGIVRFSANLMDLSANTTYYVRAFAINTAGTAYGNQISFTTSQTPSYSGSVTDASGNTYSTIAIGTQIWMAENLRTTKYSDGSNITVVNSDNVWEANFKYTIYVPMMCWQNNDRSTNTANKFGALYNWFAINPSTNGNKNICPTGWHVPSDAEWTTLTSYLGGETIAGHKMRSTGIHFWGDQNQDATNSSGFSALPGGLRSRTFSGGGDGDQGYWWSSTERSYYIENAWYRSLSTFSVVFRNYDLKENGYSIRCVKN
jgi:uncharacterized protein (TIGR02145 family)